jgi:hypothetical protein
VGGPSRPIVGLYVNATVPFIQNLRRGHYELGVDALPGMTIAVAFDELALVV